MGLAYSIKGNSVWLFIFTVAGRLGRPHFKFVSTEQFSVTLLLFLIIHYIFIFTLIYLKIYYEQGIMLPVCKDQ